MKQYLKQINDEGTMTRSLEELKGELDRLPCSSLLFHLYCGITDEKFINRLIERLKLLFPAANIAGTVSNGEIEEGRLTAPCILLSALAFERSWVKVFSFPGMHGKETEVGKTLVSLTNAFGDLACVELLLNGRELEYASVFACLKECRAELPFFGGYAMGHENDAGETFLLTGEGILKDGLITILYGGKDLFVDAGRTTGWKPLGRAFKVTGAKDRVLISMDGVPAYQLYDSYLKFPEGAELSRYAMEFPLIIKRGKMELLRHPQKRLEDDSILLDGNVSEGMDIYLSFGAPAYIIEKINKRCEKLREFEPEVILLYSCHGRKSYWGDFFNWEMEPFQKLAKTGGMCSGGQIMRNFQSGRIIEHRLTLLSVAMREGEKKNRYLPSISVDEEIMKGGISLINRMSKLVESTVTELQKSNAMLQEMNTRLEEANAELKRVSITDALTGLYNRGEIDRRIREALDAAKESGKKLSLIMLDIDFFKKVNDNYGHDIGDLVLREVSGILKANSDETLGEAAGRWGGEEFFILLPDKNKAQALDLAEQIRAQVEAHRMEKVGGVTISVGVISADGNEDYHGIYTRVDDALYRAKKGGRNRVVEA